MDTRNRMLFWSSAISETRLDQAKNKLRDGGVKPLCVRCHWADSGVP